LQVAHELFESVDEKGFADAGESRGELDADEDRAATAGLSVPRCQRPLEVIVGQHRSRLELGLRQAAAEEGQVPPAHR